MHQSDQSRGTLWVGYPGWSAHSAKQHCGAAAKHWTRSDLDKGNMGAAACIVADLNKDGRPDIACIDSTRLKWYENKPALQHQ